MMSPSVVKSCCAYACDNALMGFGDETPRPVDSLAHYMRCPILWDILMEVSGWWWLPPPLLFFAVLTCPCGGVGGFVLGAGPVLFALLLLVLADDARRDTG